MTKPLGGAEIQFVNKNVDTFEFNTKVILSCSVLGTFVKKQIKISVVVLFISVVVLFISQP